MILDRTHTDVLKLLFEFKVLFTLGLQRSVLNICIFLLDVQNSLTLKESRIGVSHDNNHKHVMTMY